MLANSPCSTELEGEPALMMPAVGVAGYCTSLLRYSRGCPVTLPAEESWDGADREDRKPFTTFWPMDCRAIDLTLDSALPISMEAERDVFVLSSRGPTFCRRSECESALSGGISLGKGGVEGREGKGEALRLVGGEL